MNPAKKVIIIEDDERLVTVLKDLLEKAGLTVLLALDGKIGLEITLKEQPDLILLDLQLPVLSGMDYLKALREDAWGKNAVVVAFTNVQTEESLNAARELGVKEYIMKSNWSVKEALDRALTFIDTKLA